MAIEDALDELYAVPPADFVTRREALAKDLRSVGNTDEAAEVHKLRKPSLVAWSVNQVARERARDVTALVNAGDDLRDAIASGDGDAIRAAMRARRARVEALTDAALERAAVLSPNPATHRDAVAATWEAATADDAARELVASGRLTTELTPSVERARGDGRARAGYRGPGRGGPKLPRARGASLPRDELAMKRAEDAVAAARQELTDATAAVKAADAELARAERAAKVAQDARRRAEGKLERAQRTLQDRRSR